MIVPFYSAFRGTFALVGADIATDGMEEWPVERLRADGFTGLATPTITEFPFTVTCNDEAEDGGAAFDWYLSQRTDVTASQYLTIEQLSATQSGSVVIDVVEANVERLLPGMDPEDYPDADNLALLLKNVHLYVQRRSDKAIQWIPLVAS